MNILYLKSLEKVKVINFDNMTEAVYDKQKDTLHIYFTKGNTNCYAGRDALDILDYLKKKALTV